MLTTHATGSATVFLIASCSFVFRVVGFIIDDFLKPMFNLVGYEIPTISRGLIHWTKNYEKNL